MKLFLRSGARHYEIEAERDGDAFVVTLDGRRHTVRRVDESVVEIDGQRARVRSASAGNQTFAALGGFSFGFTREQRDQAAHSVAAALSPQLTAPMPGKVTQVLVQSGDRVETGSALLILEAMKMENRLVAEASGAVSQVLVASGDMVDGGQVLMVIEYDAP